eukprot:CAMPEP_0194740242 /NCGR_PEP_ID=MMETSP0296-20130528/91714_1 /TAXON_ID=39354 /ORGANISM="Heterosigma akashiwo, Strain CCMP2393" /LENGTH=164 /DNA_ID=CAMNT_0039651297 /DNA_START=5 /DNA_END=495 /DNA_ORIENTATION=+
MSRLQTGMHPPLGNGHYRSRSRIPKELRAREALLATPARKGRNSSTLLFWGGTFVVCCAVLIKVSNVLLGVFVVCFSLNILVFPMSWKRVAQRGSQTPLNRRTPASPAFTKVSLNDPSPLLQEASASGEVRAQGEKGGQDDAAAALAPLPEDLLERHNLSLHGA